MQSSTRFAIAMGMLLGVLVLSGCNGQTNGSVPLPKPTTPPDSTVSMLKLLTRQAVIGSTIDPQFGQLNPYGLDVAKSTSGKFLKGDLAVCNFNAASNVQGTGYTIVALHPAAGSKPTLVAADPNSLLGCDALALGATDSIWAAAWSSNSNPVLSSSGQLITNIKGAPFEHPFGQIFAQPPSGAPVFYESNAGDGTIVRINLGATFTYDVIARGFSVNHGAPGGILGPSGLQYDPRVDTLYIVDGANNTVVALSNVTAIKAGGVNVGSDGKTFSGPSAAQARLVFAGAPLNGPISSALLFNGNLVIGNTLDPNGKNLMVEMTPHGVILDVRNVDAGPAGSLFGMVSTGTSQNDAKLYFNDDNNNNLQVLER